MVQRRERLKKQLLDSQQQIVETEARLLALETEEEEEEEREKEEEEEEEREREREREEEEMEMQQLIRQTRYCYNYVISRLFE